MKLILLERVDKLGEQFEVVKVRPGYGRNYLMPKKLALLATEGNMKLISERTRQIAAKEAKFLAERNKTIESIRTHKPIVSAKVGTSGKIFGSVTNVQLAEAIKKSSGVDLDRRKIHILDEVATLGTFKAEIHLDQNHKEEIEFEVVAG